MKITLHYVIAISFVLTIPLIGCRSDTVTFTPGKAHPTKTAIWRIYETIRKGNSVSANSVIEELGEPFRKEMELNGDRWFFAASDGKEVLGVTVNSAGVIIGASIMNTY